MKSQERLSGAVTVLVSQYGPKSPLAQEGKAHGTRLALLASAVVVALALGLGLFVARGGPSPAAIAPQAYERVKEGMTREGVQSALRLPAGDYRDEAHKPGGRSYTEWSEQAAEEEFGSGETAGRLAWEGNEYSVVVGFDDAGVVSWKTLWRHVPPTR